ncbi:MAG TPA: DNA polymerase III subunit gamma/tau [Candidatus Saccharibacteria bacterium]|nr:DNA polymerase III subunit gamma/tau [Candidatus Saccharibacteria bacterium]
MGKALYRTYRSRSLDEVVGQPHITELLGQALKQGRIAHAYLFTGPKGVGKTSIARILAHEINQLPYSDESTHLDIIEIDAASNNGVDDIRDLREKVQLAPVSAAKKVYIIDEVHMLSKPAFNALLKTLEEPPEHVVFILATTDLDKVPETILSRTQRYNFKRASAPDLVKNLERIASKEKISTDPRALDLIATHADGSFRDSVSMLDQLASLADPKTGITEELVERSFGLAADAKITSLLEATVSGETAAIVRMLKDFENNGTPARTIVTQLVAKIHNSVAESPSLLPLLDQLLTIPASSSPELKLLTVLCMFNPGSDSPVSKAPTPPAPTPTEPERPEKPEIKEEKPKKPEVAQQKPNKPNASALLEWSKLLSYVTTHHVALGSVLKKCDAIFDNGTLTIYCKNTFYKKKLDDLKYRALINSSLEVIGAADVAIETSAASAPIQNSQAAKVAAIMGGGEEVSVEDAA